MLGSKAEFMLIKEMRYSLSKFADYVEMIIYCYSSI